MAFIRKFNFFLLLLSITLNLSVEKPEYEWLMSYTKRKVLNIAQSCPDDCICGYQLYEGAQKYVVNCTNTGSIRNNFYFLPVDTQVLIFTGNNIAEFDWLNVFQLSLICISLTVLDLSNNQIRKINKIPSTYQYMPNLQQLILSHNNLIISHDDHPLSILPKFDTLRSLHLINAFDDNYSAHLNEDLHDILNNGQLHNLVNLHLEQNKITHFRDPKVFCALPNLRELYLADNLLTELNFEVHCLSNLQLLDLQRNKLQFVKTEHTAALNELQSRRHFGNNLNVDFNLNPFVCDEIESFRNWILSTKVIVNNKSNLLCYRNGAKPLRIIEMETRHRLYYTELIRSSPMYSKDQNIETNESLGLKVNFILFVIIVILDLVGSLVTVMMKCIFLFSYLKQRWIRSVGKSVNDEVEVCSKLNM
ncbi:leucine-rich repeat neuronal protein 3-like [Teleopsis dalmanni]|uniref:leucine-rich repeat neuronal protein 3-like n=1 Tax=Teleopsis dalmanni TaxID=139649 RepID=UPI0018CF405B|nr:leucine-rich repeat neuronal protein 3-like [Teleopsis dalmanni]